ncbi:MAG: nucleotidyl transferase AbiEii/AbiGii toxin family protein [Acidobacteriota bacterium]
MAFDLYGELTNLLASLQEAEIDYALCGGLAMAVHGFPRATVDIDLLILAGDAEAALQVAESRGFTVRADPMSFFRGDVQIRRVSKIEPETGEPIPIDFMLVTPAIAEVWNDRRKMTWEAGDLWVVSRAGMITLKAMRGSKLDLADIEHLSDGVDG